MAAGSLEGLQLVVDDADAAHAELSGRGVEVSEVDDQPWGRFVYFKDPGRQRVERAGDQAGSAGLTTDRRRRLRDRAAPRDGDPLRDAAA